MLLSEYLLVLEGAVTLQHRVFSPLSPKSKTIGHLSLHSAFSVAEGRCTAWRGCARKTRSPNYLLVTSIMCLTNSSLSICPLRLLSIAATTPQKFTMFKRRKISGFVNIW